MSAGTYTLTATALVIASPQNTFTRSITFRVVAAGGDISEPVNGAAPMVITALTYPEDDAKDVPTTVFPQVVFTEPVTRVNVVGNVKLEEIPDDGATQPPVTVSIKLVGIAPNGRVIEFDSSTPPEQQVTSLTIQPQARLKFGMKYTLSLTSGIQDLDTLEDDTPAPMALVPYDTTFTTAKAEALTPPSTDFSSSGIATVGKFAFVVENRFQQGILRVFDISDPAKPVEIPEGQKSMAGRPMDIAAQADDNGGATVVVITGPTNVSLPSNLRIYQVYETGASDWIGAASLTVTATEGIAQRVAINGSFAYATTTMRGIQVVDIEYAEWLFDERGGDTSRIRIPLNTDGMGFGQEAVVATIPVLKENGRAAFLSDLKVADLVDGFMQPIVLATGDIGLTTVNPQTSEVLFPKYSQRVS